MDKDLRQAIPGNINASGLDIRDQDFYYREFKAKRSTYSHGEIIWYLEVMPKYRASVVLKPKKINPQKNC